MADDILTKYTYAITETLNDAVNVLSLQEELDEASGLTVSVSNVYTVGTDIIIELDGDAVAADETIVDGVVAAHTGAVFSEPPLEEEDNTVISEATGVATEIIDLDTGPLPEGDYMIHWNAEFSTTTATPVVDAQVNLMTLKSGGSAITRAQSHNNTNKWRHFGGAYLLSIKNGNEYNVSLTLKGDTTNSAKIRRSRIYITNA